MQPHEPIKIPKLARFMVAMPVTSLKFLGSLPEGAWTWRALFLATISQPAIDAAPYWPIGAEILRGSGQRSIQETT